MKLVKEIVKSIREELEDAEKYAWAAVHAKTEHHELADLYARLAGEELDHANMLHKQATEVIEQHKRQGYEAPVAMKAVWDWEHERYMEEYAEIKRILDMYRA